MQEKIYAQSITESNLGKSLPDYEHTKSGDLDLETRPSKKSCSLKALK